MWTLPCSLWCDSLIQFTCLVTYSLEQSPSWEANRFSASQEIPRIFWNPKVHYVNHKCLTVPERYTFVQWGVVSTSPNPPSWRTTPCQLSATAYSIYSQLSSILEAVPPSATWGRAMPCRQELTYHSLIQYGDRKCKATLCGGHVLQFYVISSPPHWCTEYSPNSAIAFMEQIYGKRCGIPFTCVWWCLVSCRKKKTPSTNVR